jgi:prepilin-type N-terminal cleavage/methylation domain-containing protein
MRELMPAENIVLPTDGSIMARLVTRSRVLRSRGFTIIELLVVVAIMCIVMAIAVPTMTTTVDSFRMRGSMTESANMALRCRMAAIKRDTSQRLHITTVGTTLVTFITDQNDANVAPVVGDPQMSGQYWFPPQFNAIGVPTGAGAPPQMTALFMWGSAIAPNVNVDPYFNTRGLPCLPNAAGVCDATTGFVYYIRYLRAGNVRWSAMSISPAGRVQTWFWNGASWGN